VYNDFFNGARSQHALCWKKTFEKEEHGKKERKIWKGEEEQ